MCDYPWYMQLFNTELLDQKKKQWEIEAQAKGMSLPEYLKMFETQIIPEDKEKM